MNFNYLEKFTAGWPYVPEETYSQVLKRKKPGLIWPSADQALHYMYFYTITGLDLTPNYKRLPCSVRWGCGISKGDAFSFRHLVPSNWHMLYLMIPIFSRLSWFMALHFQHPSVLSGFYFIAFWSISISCSNTVPFSLILFRCWFAPHKLFLQFLEFVKDHWSGFNIRKWHKVHTFNLLHQNDVSIVVEFSNV